MSILAERGIKTIVIAGYPEGLATTNQNLDAAQTSDILLRKIKALVAQGFNVTVATQFTFDPTVLSMWLKQTRLALQSLDINHRGIKFYVGVVGPATHRTLCRVARACAVKPMMSSGSSMLPNVTDDANLEMVRRAGMDESRGDVKREIWPDEIVLEIAKFCVEENVPEEQIGLHIYPFGGFDRAVDMTKALADGTWP
jgi:5,10-methylenetetrahydrofolate reductase